MIILFLLIVAGFVASGVYLFKRDEYSCGRYSAYDHWISRHGDALWDRISLIGKIAGLGLIGVIVGAVWHDIMKAKGSGSFIVMGISGAVVAIGLAAGATGLFLHRCYDARNRLPALRVLSFGCISGLFAGILAALNLPEIPDGTVGMLMKKSLTLDLTDELVGSVSAFLKVSDPSFYWHAIVSTPITSVIGCIFGFWMVLTVLTHRRWRAANDPTRARLYPILAAVFGVSAFLLAVVLGVFISGYALKLILGILTLITGLFLMFVVLPWFVKSSFEIIDNNAKSSSADDFWSNSHTSTKNRFSGSDGEEYVGDSDNPYLIRKLGSPQVLKRNSDGDFVDPDTGKSVSLMGRSRL